MCPISFLESRRSEPCACGQSVVDVANAVCLLHLSERNMGPVGSLFLKWVWDHCVDCLEFKIIHIHNDHISPPTPTRTRTCTNARHRACVLICMNIGLSFTTAPRSQAILTTYPMGTEHESRGDSAGSPVICSSTFQKLTLSYMLRHSNRVNVRVSWEGRGPVKLSRLGGCVVCFPQWSGLVRIELGEDCIQLNVTIGNQKHMT